MDPSRPSRIWALVITLALAGCTRTHTLGVRLQDVDPGAAAFEVWLVPGGTCEADADALAAALNDGGPEGRHVTFRDPPAGGLFADVGDGPSRLLVLARGADCRPVQVGCTAFEPGATETVTVTMQSGGAGLAACPGTCTDGLCEGPPVDGGASLDAGPDAGPDASVDAGCEASDGGSTASSCALDEDCPGPSRCVSMTCTGVTVERASATLRPPVGTDYADELSFVTTPGGGDDTYVNQMIGLLEVPRGGGDAVAQLWALHEADADASRLVADGRRDNPAVPTTCAPRDMRPTFSPRPLDAPFGVALGGLQWPLWGVLGTAGGDPAMAMGIPFGGDDVDQACELRPGVTLRGPVVRAGDNDAGGRFPAYTWIEQEGGSTYLARYEWEDELDRVAFPATSLDGIGAAGAPGGFHVVYELAPRGPLFIWDTRGTIGYELERTGAAGPPTLAAVSETRYVVAYSVETAECPSRGVVLREVECNPSCGYTGTETTVPGRYEQVRLTHLEEGGFALAALEPTGNRIVASFFDEALQATAIGGERWLEVRTLGAGDVLRHLRLSSARACRVPPAQTRIGVAAMLGSDADGPPDRIQVDVLRYAAAGCP